MEFIHLNCHSYYSMMAGADRPEALFRRAKAFNMNALAITDTNGLYGAVEAQRVAGEAGVKNIFGTVIDQPRAKAPRAKAPRNIILIARNIAGYGEICRVITDRRLNEDNFEIAMASAKLTENVVLISSDPPVLEACRVAGRGEGLYVELVNYGDTPSRRKIADSLRLAKRFDLPCVATNNVHFAGPEGYEVHRVLSAIRTNTTINQLPPYATAHPEAWLKPPEAMERLFAETPEAIGNTIKIADECDVTLDIGRLKFPKFPLKRGETPYSRLLKLSVEGINQRYNPVTLQVTKRLEEELCVIDKLNFAEYFLVVWDIVHEAKRRGVPTVGRGSAANSIVCYALCITDICPLKYNLYFERFMNLERKDCPDIDIDFPWNKRGEIIDYVYETYGADKVAMIGTHNTLRGRSAIREVGKAMGIPIEEIERFTKRLPAFIQISELEDARARIPECGGLPIEDEPYRSIIKIGRKVEGFPRHLSIHCGGIVVSPTPITDLVPLQRSARGVVITQMDMYPIEDLGLVKIDLLGQRGLAVISDVKSAVKRNYDITIDWRETDPTTDPATKRIMREGKTMGCFYVESPGMRGLLKKLRVDDFETLVAASSIIRPGVSDSGMMKAYIERSLGREKPSCLHPSMERVLKETFGVMIYQEDVLKVVNVVAGMSLAEADSLRKCMSKKRNRERMDKYKGRFIDGAARRGVETKTAEEIWRQIESFGGYAFCKAHSASFAVVSYQTAYLKAHYPAEFMAAVIANHGGFYGAAAYIEEARRLGLDILPPDVNKSHEECVSEVD
ncbi:DNA polymerase III alpha subunit [hydrothermal vent metagenome]|uniref:DNA polymerase III alpha subunit n=1 Tax=hydrothermal vent metagenome TaxID=652676 RepID=A0A3B1BXF9_9ZZZZ